MRSKRGWVATLATDPLAESLPPSRSATVTAFNVARSPCTLASPSTPPSVWPRNTSLAILACTPTTGVDLSGGGGAGGTARDGTGDAAAGWPGWSAIGTAVDGSAGSAAGGR